MGYEDEDLEEEEPPLVGVEDFDDEADAIVAARELVEHGIGATVERMVAEAEVVGTEDDLAPEVDGEADGEGADTDGAEPPRAAGTIFYRLLVLDHEERRALEVLGLVEPEDRPEANPIEPMVPVKAKIPWMKVIPIYLLALILVPAAAFYLTYLVVSR